MNKNKNKKAELVNAICFYTDGELTPSIYSTTYQPLVDRLEEWNACPFEFCFFVCFFKQGIEAKGPIRLTFTNLLNSSNTFKEFMKFSRKRQTDIPKIVALSRETFDTNLNLYRDARFVLDNLSIAINAVLRVEMALEHGYEDIAQKYEVSAIYVVKGCPEYLKYCPLLKARIP